MTGFAIALVLSATGGSHASWNYRAKKPAEEWWVGVWNLKMFSWFHTYQGVILCVIIKEMIVLATNLQIDVKLIQKAVRLGGHKTKKAAVSKALIEYIQNLEQEKILSMFGTVEYDPKYDYKKQRRRSWRSLLIPVYGLWL